MSTKKKEEKKVKSKAEKVAEKLGSGEPAGDETPKPARKSRPKPVDLVAEVVNKYNENGWQAIRAPVGSINDVVAQKAKRFHFVQVVTKETIDEPKYHGAQKNNFIQNAFSNGATPVFAHVVISNVKAADGTKNARAKITFEDVNVNGRVIIGGKREKKSGESAEEAQPEE